MPTLDELVVKFGAENKELKRKVKEINKDVKGVKTNTNKLNKSFSTLGTTIVAALSVGAVIAFTTKINDLAVSIQSINQKALVVFGDNLEAITEDANKNAIQMGLTANEYIRAGAAMQDLLVPLGFGRKEATGMTTEILNLSGALSVWTGGQKSAEEVSTILTKALLGENEQLKTLGVTIRQDSKEFINLVKSIKLSEGATDGQARAMATLELIMNKTVDAQTNFTEGAKTLAQAQGEVTAELRTQLELLSVQLTPAISAATSKFSDMIKEFISSIQVFKALKIFFTLDKDAANAYAESLLGAENQTIDYVTQLKEHIRQQKILNLVTNDTIELTAAQIAALAKAAKASEAAAQAIKNQRSEYESFIDSLKVSEGLLKLQAFALSEINSLMSDTSFETREIQIPTGRAKTELDEMRDKLEENKKKLEELQTIAESVGRAIGSSFETMGGAIIDSFGLASTGMEGFLAVMLKTVTKIIAMLLSNAIASAIAAGWLSSLSLGPLAVFGAPAFVATAVGGVVAAFAAIPAFAEGGLAFGPTLGLMGEGIGTSRSNPEVIAPLDKLANFMPKDNGFNGKVIFRIEGRELVGILEKERRTTKFSF